MPSSCCSIFHCSVRCVLWDTDPPVPTASSQETVSISAPPAFGHLKVSSALTSKFLFWLHCDISLGGPAEHCEGKLLILLHLEPFSCPHSRCCMQMGCYQVLCSGEAQWSGVSLHKAFPSYCFGAVLHPWSSRLCVL